jgi:hypothetical protein
MNTDSYYALFLIKTVLFIIGVSFVVAAIIIKKSYDNKIKNCTALAQGVVADWTLERIGHGSYQSVSMSNNSRSWFPTYEYLLRGQVIRVKGNVGQRKAGPVGVPVTIHYNPMNPDQIYINENEGKIFELIFGIIGVVFLMFVIILTIVFA